MTHCTNLSPQSSFFLYFFERPMMVVLTFLVVFLSKVY